MTGILTKQNAIDQALVGGGGGDKLTNNGLLQTLHVYHEATFDGKTEFANLEESSVTFNSRPVFENDFIVKVNQEPYTLTSILDVQDQLWSDKKTLFKNVEILDDTIEVCLDKMFELTDTINNHLTANPDISQTQTENIQKSPTVLLNDVDAVETGEEVENPDIENPGVELTPKVDETLALYDSMISSVTTTLEHFENNDSTLYDMTTDNTAKINLVNRAIDNINFDLGEKNKDIIEIYETLDEHKTNIETNAVNLSTSNEKIDKLQLSLKALVDQIQSLDRAQDNHLDVYTETNVDANTYSVQRRSLRTRANADTETDAVIDDAKVNDVMVDWITTMNDSFKHFEENDKTLKNNLESNYTTTTDLTKNYALKTEIKDSYTKTETDNLLEPINENISLAASNIELLTGRVNLIQGSADTLENYALKTELTIVDNKFANYTTKSQISKSINCIFNEFIKNDQSKVNYTDEAARLISYFRISSNLCAIDFDTIPSTMKYLVVYFYLPYDGYYYDQAFVMIYDNIQQSGSFVLFSPDNRYQFLTSSVKKKYISNSNTILCCL